MLPPELTDRIIDFLHDDSAALKACSLTCRAWLPRSRFHKFNFIFLVGRLLGRFTHLLRDYPHVGAYVDTMHLSVQSLAEVERFASISTSLVNLHDLEVEILFQMESYSAFPLITSVTNLTLFSLDGFVHLGEVADFLQAFPNVKSFWFQATALKHHINDQHGATLLANTLGTMPLENLGWEYDMTLFALCASIHPLTRLQTLRLRPCSNADLLSLSLLLHTFPVPTCLRELTVDFEDVLPHSSCK